ncbi:TPA: hypothetical protein ACG04D_003812 [Escherichia coli]|nr:hypothetical protein [Escherichia coli]MDO1642182.1 hypothetical protein [Escherichia coli]
MTTITREQALKIIEAADEVISALAGTNEDVHPGSDNMLRLWDDLNDRYAPPEVVRELARIALASLEAEPVSQAYNLAELIEGMEVSIDVSTCDADLGNRYFGTVTEALELDTAKNGYILLVQDAEPNFDVNGNSPVTPDSWISRFEEMPDPSSERRVCAFTPTNHEDMRYRFVPASLFKTVCRDATHWFYMLPPVGREEVAGG